jgi:CheY-like chemotaxis protein/signal transduction histidine kinase
VVMTWLAWACWRLPGQLQQFVMFVLPNIWAVIKQDELLRLELLGVIRYIEGTAYLWQFLFFVHYLLDFLRTGYLHVAAVLYGAMCVTIVLIALLAPAFQIFYQDVLVFSLISVTGYWFQGAHAHRVRRQLFQKHFEEQMERLDELRRSEEKARVATALQDSAQQADGILNHILKNSMADAAGCVHLFLNSAVPDRLDLQKALECLARGMQWCHNRLALIHIAAGQYVPDLVVVELKHLVGEVVAGRPVQSDASASSVLLDPLLTQIVLGNVVDNAFRHGHTVDPHVTLTAHLCPLPRAANAPLSRRELVVEISNIADPDRPHVTEDLVTSVLQNRNRPMYPIIDNTDDPSALPPSDHVGLAEIFAAARAHGMNPTLSQVGDVVTFRASMEVTVVKSNSELSLTSLAAVAAATPMPSHPLSNLRFFVLDDSAIARRLLVQTLTTTVQPQSVKAYGATPEEVHDFRLEALQNADVLIVDQYLDYDGACFLGTTVIRQLLADGFPGLIAIRSANGSRKDQLAYFSHGAHCVIGKDVPPKELLDMISEAYVQHVHLQREAGPQSGGRRRAEAASVPYRIWKGGSKEALLSHSNEGVPLSFSLPRSSRPDPRTTTFGLPTPVAPTLP